MNRLVATVAIVAALAIGTTGCLSGTHRIPKRDLIAISSMAPQERGRAVRVIQDFEASEQPPTAPRVGTSGNVGVVVVSSGGHHDGRAPRRATRRKSKSASKVKKDDAKALIIVAALVAIGLAATEGARYDGWVSVNPAHPVHIKRYDGSFTWVPLNALTPEIAASAQKAWIRDTEGPWHEVGRAPLNRQGWTYSWLLGMAEMPSSDGTFRNGPFSHIQLGRFTDRTFGILFDMGLGWRDNEFGETVFESRYALELQYLPVGAGKLHLGVFGQAGTALRIEDSVKAETPRRGLVFGGGGLVQLELTTRLALTARAGLSMFAGTATSDLTFGVSVY